MKKEAELDSYLIVSNYLQYINALKKENITEINNVGLNNIEKNDYSINLAIQNLSKEELLLLAEDNFGTDVEQLIVKHFNDKKYTIGEFREIKDLYLSVTSDFKDKVWSFRYAKQAKENLSKIKNENDKLEFSNYFNKANEDNFISDKENGKLRVLFEKSKLSEELL